jgi:hypothetical protein
MRAQAFEKLLVLIEKEWEDMPVSDDVCFSQQWKNMNELVAMSKILRSRTNDENVMKELFSRT